MASLQAFRPLQLNETQVCVISSYPPREMSEINDNSAEVISYIYVVISVLFHISQRPIISSTPPLHVALEELGPLFL